MLYLCHTTVTEDLVIFEDEKKTSKTQMRYKTKRKLLSGHSRAVVHMNSQHMKHQAENLPKPKTEKSQMERIREH